MYTLEHLQYDKAYGLPLYPVRVVPKPFTANDYAHIVDWCHAHNIHVHIPAHAYYFYFNSEQDALFFILGYQNDNAN